MFTINEYNSLLIKNISIEEKLKTLRNTKVDIENYCERCCLVKKNVTIHQCKNCCDTCLIVSKHEDPFWGFGAKCRSCCYEEIEEEEYYYNNELSDEEKQMIDIHNLSESIESKNKVDRIKHSAVMNFREKVKHETNQIIYARKILAKLFDSEDIGMLIAKLVQ